jgi:hypothetical protein
MRPQQHKGGVGIAQAFKVIGQCFSRLTGMVERTAYKSKAKGGQKGILNGDPYALAFHQVFKSLPVSTSFYLVKPGHLVAPANAGTVLCPVCQAKRFVYGTFCFGVFALLGIPYGKGAVGIGPPGWVTVPEYNCCPFAQRHHILQASQKLAGHLGL